MTNLERFDTLLDCARESADAYHLLREGERGEYYNKLIARYRDAAAIKKDSIKDVALKIESFENTRIPVYEECFREETYFDHSEYSNNESVVATEHVAMKANPTSSWDPKRWIYPVPDDQIAWDDGPAFGCVVGDRVAYAGTHQDLVTYGEYEVWNGTADNVYHDTVQLVRTDKQNFTYDQSTITVNSDEIYWINSY